MKLDRKNHGGMASRGKNVWGDITEKDFLEEKDIEDREIGEYDQENMMLFIANSNLFRHLSRLADSLKPVERRCLYACYQVKATQGNKAKSTIITSAMMKYHPHGDQVCYSGMVNMAQSWKRQCPLIAGKGNFGNASNPDIVASQRYTEAGMSKYAWECFFADYDPECVETQFNTTADADEPMALPSKFPNILVNGGMGIAVGNNFKIPPYNIYDIIDVVGRVLRNPDTTDVFMIPDFPCDCDIVDDGQELHNIINDGIGNLKIRGRIDIEPFGHGWALRIRSAPWMVNFQTVLAKIRSLAASGVLAIQDIQEANAPVQLADGRFETAIDTRIIISGAHDPNVIREKLYQMTDLEQTASVNFRVVTEYLKVQRFGMKALIQAWIDERRSYKRRLFNKRLRNIDARLDLLEILLYLTEGKNLQKTVDVIRQSNDKDIPENLMKLCKMSSYQAVKIADMGLRAFSKDSHKRYQDEQDRLLKERKEIMKIVGSEKRIDDIIWDELQDLRKYGSPRRTNVIQPTKGVKVSDTEHFLIATKEGQIKKLKFKGPESYKWSMGSFRTGDYPIYREVYHNMDSAIFFDTFGRYSIVPVHEIDNNEPAQYGHNLFTLTKLSGKVVTIFKYMEADTLENLTKIAGEPYLVTITANGYIKKTKFTDIQGIRSTKNVRCMKIRDDDSLAYAGILFGDSNVLIYTKNGNYVFLSMDSISEQAKDSMGLTAIKVDADDQVIGASVIGKDDAYIAVVTNKGAIKRCETRYFGTPTKRSASNTQSYLTTLEVADSVYSVIGLGIDSGLMICTRTDVVELEPTQIPVLSRKAKCKKLVAIPNGSSIINVFESKDN